MLLLAQFAAVAWPAYACGCGGMVTDPDDTIAVERETSVVTWDGTTERIVMSLTVGGDATEAAWIMPVPHRAEVALGERELFDDLRAATAPEQRTRHYFWPREGDWPRGDGDDEGDTAGAPPMDGAPPVDVISRDRLGPFDVARLAATDPGALDAWLGENGFTLPDDLAAGLAPYVEQGWEYVAIRLAPSADEGEGGEGGEGGDGDGAEPAVLGGTLDPISLTFAADEPVYPMRLSANADTEQSLTLYVLGPGRMEPEDAIGGSPPEVTFAARLPVDEQPEGPLRDLAAGDTFLTVVEQSFPEPSAINGDHTLSRSAQDTEVRPVEYEDELLTWAGVPAWLVTVLGAALLLGAGGGLGVHRVRRHRRTARLLGVHRP
ncbi:DUF2330 domain-containing protein [Streptomyces radicis]|uniref:DUF2330 domain-containing protein n=1 Tax=Streptomyces radicis TaxID=1750517 RepID=A0A3A9VY15_9ACTN|nr:DUF2330 domain-containing protein [Streptomyces radicis]RKN16919.1 DUF2330 domain-containing protein [Streptomyces radicis]